MEIPGLRDSLVKILQDYNLQVCATQGVSRGVSLQKISYTVNRILKII